MDAVEMVNTETHQGLDRTSQIEHHINTFQSAPVRVSRSRINLGRKRRH